MAKRPGLRFRFMAINAVVMLAVLVSAYFSQAHLAQAERTAELLSQRSIEAIDLASRLETLMHEKSYVSNYLLSADPQYLHQTQEHYQGVGRWIDGMSAFADTPEEDHLVDALRQGYTRYVQEGDKVIALDRVGDRQAALVTFFDMKREVESLLYNGQRLFALEATAMQSSRLATTEAIERQRHTMFALIGVGSLLSIVMSALLTARAVRPIYSLVLRLEQASGDVTTLESHDELGALESHVAGLLARVRTQERKLARSARLSQLGELAAELAHEILNPIAGVKAMLQALRRAPASAPPTAEGLAYELEAMERDLGRVEHTIKRLMRYARPLEPALAPTPLGELVDGALVAVRKLPAHAGRAFAVAPYDLQATWLLDKQLVIQVLVNLLVNACEASPPDQPVHLTVTIEHDTLDVRVRDHGPGLSQEAQARLFHPFFTTKASGNGLGLAVSRNIIQEHGGDISGSSAAQGGAEFTVTLPRGGA